MNSHPDMVAPGPSVRLVSLAGLAREFGIREADAQELCERLDGVEVLSVPSANGDRPFVNLHALEYALFTVTDPRTPTECMAMIAETYAGIRRKSLINQLRYVGHHMFSGIRQRKRRRELSARGPGRPKGSRDKKPRARRTKDQIKLSELLDKQVKATVEILAAVCKEPDPVEAEITYVEC
ncbi:hypothetical protein LCGC14_1611010 [marine sediment metagenome]|uniref:Uncharacterized protein n=1 Tax=marine sediment metagenome TaxID=412755 RepID=A0A0F9L8H1_9ZZZZ